jgi:2,4-dienoyl-CoA reductase (NADPH2)
LAKIHDPIMIRNVELKNRLYAPPMISNIVGEDCCAGKALIDATHRRARGGWGLYCIEGAVISETTRVFARTVGIFDNSQEPSLYELADAIHAGGAKAMIQLHHAGRLCNPQMLPKHVKQEALAPSDTTPVNPFVPDARTRGLTEEEIWGIIDEYVNAALRAKRASFDMVLIHCSHGFLPQQFMSPFTNHRNDKWGGDWDRRLEFMRQLLTKMRAAVGDYPICCRVAGDEFVEGGYTIDDFCKYIAPVMEEAGCDMFDVTCGIWEHFSPVIPEMYEPRGVWTYLAEAIKKVVKVPVTGLGRINDGRLAVKMIEDGKFDIVGIGRGSIADCDFAKKTIEGRYDDIRQCIACSSCSHDDLVGRPSRCAINFEYDRDNSWEEEKMLLTARPKNVLVIGGGPGGMEFARVATLRGHKAVVCEKSDKLGGYLHLAASLPKLYTRELLNIVRWLSKKMTAMAIPVELNTEVTLEMILARKPDIVVLATGSKEVIPDIPGVDGPNVITLDEFLAKKKPVGKRVAILGGAYGAEIAVTLAREGKKMPEAGYKKYHKPAAERALEVTDAEKVKEVTLLEEGGPMVVGMPPYSQLLRFMVLNEFLAEAGATVLPQTKVKEITAAGVNYVDSVGQEKTVAADTVILAVGRTGNRDLYRQLVGKGIDFHEIGDCTGPEKVEKAIHMANHVARQI